MSDETNIETVDSFEHSATIGKLALALARASLEFSAALKDRENPAYRGSKYVPLENLIDATRPALSKNELAVMQLPSLSDQDVQITTVLAHSSGEWISSSLRVPGTMRDRFDAQSVGSGITYARRYSYQSILNIAGEVDDDGNAAAGVGSKEAAHDIAKRKVAEHVAKTGKPVLAFTPGDAGMIYLTGNEAMSLLRVNISEQDKALVIWLPNTKKNAIPADQMEKFFGLCEQHGIEPKVVPAAPNGTASAPSEAVPTIRSCERGETKKHQVYLKVRYGTSDVSSTLNCFHKELFEYLEKGVGKPASLIVEKVKDYQNVVGIEKIGNQTFSLNQDGHWLPDIQASEPPPIDDNDIPPEMFPQ